MKGMELLRSKEWSGKFVDCALRFALAAVLSGAQVFGGYAPLALGLTAAAGPGVRGLSALVGASGQGRFSSCPSRTRCALLPRRCSFYGEQRLF